MNRLYLLYLIFILSCGSNNSYYLIDYQSFTIYSGLYTHKVWYKEAEIESEEIHIYIDGDGKPWKNRFFISSDPTKKSSVIQSLMDFDYNEKVYFGRPCYHGFSYECRSEDWTYDRYGSHIIKSMNDALTEYLNKKVKNFKSKKIILIGYSGGGAIAVLMARELKYVSKVITLAGNLDIDSWVNLHGYTYLNGSVNPVDLTYGHANLNWLFFFGGEDKNVPYEVMQSNIEIAFPDAKIMVLPGVAHTTGWGKYYEIILY
ncbi:dienelactone hydrolase family protein [Photobacterium sanctipauli]|uniref:dienelactone hydrolase family protein n=2 Tax=Photobacterium sanctipauli TaxID=1342794 RepID=UPI000D165E81|nr:dienelactone hydrolase family protein [Photobacterium sanctipauli]